MGEKQKTKRPRSVPHSVRAMRVAGRATYSDLLFTRGKAAEPFRSFKGGPFTAYADARAVSVMPATGHDQRMRHWLAAASSRLALAPSSNAPRSAFS